MKKEIRNLNSLNVDQESYESKKQPPQVLCKKRVLRNFTNFVGKHRCFPMNFTKFLRKRFLQNTAGRLLLETILVHLLSEKIPSEIRSVLASKFGKEVLALKFLQEILEIELFSKECCAAVSSENSKNKHNEEEAYTTGCFHNKGKMFLCVL